MTKPIYKFFTYLVYINLNECYNNSPVNNGDNYFSHLEYLEYLYNNNKMKTRYRPVIQIDKLLAS